MCICYNHGQKSWDTFAFLGHFPIHTGPTPPLTPQTMLDSCIQNFFRVSTLYRVGGGRTARNFQKGCTVLRGNREMTEKYDYCSSVPRTFVQDCCSWVERKSFYRKSELQTFLMISGGHIGVPKLYTNMVSPYKALQKCAEHCSKWLRNCGLQRPETWDKLFI